jgi:hypothetical protein
MKNFNSDIRNYIRMILEQDDSRLKRDQLKCTLKLIMTPDAHVPDTLTRIRALQSVTVVGQDDPVDRTSEGSTVLKIYVKYLPTSGDIYKNLKSLSKLIKSLPDVKIVRVLTSEGRPVLFKGKPIVV